MSNLSILLCLCLDIICLWYLKIAIVNHRRLMRTVSILPKVSDVQHLKIKMQGGFKEINC
jgi:hypothetical protein